MRRFITQIIIAVIVVSCGNTEKTVECLRSELSSIRMNKKVFSSVAEIAGLDSLNNVAAFCMAIAESEKIREKNCMDILMQMKADTTPLDVSVFPDYPDENYLKNVVHAYDMMSIRHEASYIVAESERAKKAKEFFANAKTSDGKILNYLQMAEAAVDAKDDLMLGAIWKVCSVCGDVYLEEDFFDACDICGAPKSQFIEFLADEI